MIIGAGMGGLAAAIDLAARGVPVTLVESAPEPGGKMRTLEAGGAAIDAGPTVLTLRAGFEQLFADAGASLADHVSLTRAERLARHAWGDDQGFDLYPDPERSVDEAGRFAGAAQARAFARFLRDGQKLYEALEPSFLFASRPSPPGLTLRMLAQNPAGVTTLRPFSALWDVLGGYFPDARLRQLYGRYATYCGSSPFEAPATLMMIAALEQQGVWFVDGGMTQLSRAMAGLARALGAQLRYDTKAEAVLTAHGRVSGVRLAGGEIIAARAVLANGDPDALRAGCLGPAAAQAMAPAHGPRSLSAVVWTGVGEAEGFALERHNVFFSGDYRAEFGALFDEQRMPDDPTIYICAQDRGAGPAPRGAERFLILINAPPDGERRAYGLQETGSWLTQVKARLRASGLTLELDAYQTTAPDGFAARFPGTGGALYGRALHGWRAAFARPGAKTRLPGLYLAGGGTHPGPGVPTSMLSGRTAARAILADFASTPRWRPAGIAGSTPTPSARTDASASS
ncbi:1-hydroxycarotenoid 3,4-desaturase CrtD [Alkalicaulis satelles]|uniref:1-hydroxycarotenoid 3,4-desaturase CrtD n=1 Tax=Alkalicaulis satelles TaxID=2609175 RepID=UPI001E44FC0E|nr:1-hydroxycarotenoid 3,4-desaturase CrtD [Alkalicaulis satelles]